MTSTTCATILPCDETCNAILLTPPARPVLPEQCVTWLGVRVFPNPNPNPTHLVLVLEQPGLGHPPALVGRRQNLVEGRVVLAGVRHAETVQRQRQRALSHGCAAG